MVSSNDAAEYKPLLGDLRKVKRFINLLFLLQVERAELDKTDFHRADLVNLILLHLNYPGLFREIYSRETEGRSGFFSVARAPEANGFKTSHRLEELIKSCDPPAKFLLKKLFDAETLGMNIASSDEAASRSRACFNEVPHRNLESYLNLIVRFIVPERQETFALYTAAADRVFEGGQSVESILAEKDLCIDREAYPHDQFWRVLANRAAGGTREGIFGAIDALLDLLPKYSSVDGLSKTTSELGLSLRDRSIFTLLRLLDALGTAGMPRGRGGSENDFRSFIREQIFGKGSAGAGSIIDRLSDDRRTALGWNDLMLFRLQSSVDRLGRLQYVVAALLSTDDPSATLDGAVSDIACRSMRVLSQEIFSRFSKAYIQTEINFFDHVDELSDEDLLGIEWKSVLDKYSTTEDLHQILSHRLAATRTSIKSFVMYQLSNVSAGLGSGIGCGFYDEAGIDDQRGISRRMNEYVFDVCFGGKSRNQPYYHFVDFCLAHLSSGYFTGDEVNRYLPTREGIIGGFDAEQMRQYWQESGTAIRQAVALAPERKVVVENYVAVYAEHAIALFEVLDAL
jgi:hypothetical protein